MNSVVGDELKKLALTLINFQENGETENKWNEFASAARQLINFLNSNVEIAKSDIDLFIDPLVNVLHFTVNFHFRFKCLN